MIFVLLIWMHTFFDLAKGESWAIFFDRTHLLFLCSFLYEIIFQILLFNDKFFFTCLSFFFWGITYLLRVRLDREPLQQIRLFLHRLHGKKLANVDTRRVGRGGTYSLSCMAVVVWPSTLASLLYGHGARRVIIDRAGIACTKREAKRGVLGKSHEGRASCILLRIACEDGIIASNCMIHFLVWGNKKALKSSKIKQATHRRKDTHKKSGQKRRQQQRNKATKQRKRTRTRKNTKQQEKRTTKNENGRNQTKTDETKRKRTTKNYSTATTP